MDMNKLTIVNQHLKYPQVTLKEPTDHHYLLIAAEIDTFILPKRFSTSHKKKEWLKHCKQWCKELENISGVVEAVVFTAILMPPGRGEFVKQREGNVHIAKFDAAILIEVKNKKILTDVQNSDSFKSITSETKKVANYIYQTDATNIKRIDSVDHKRQGVFLFNYFFADDTQQNLDVWNYTAGYFQKESGLDNSTVLLPEHRGEANYTIINHCRWDKLQDILPTLTLKPSFHHYVLENFFANNTAAMPILYEIA